MNAPVKTKPAPAPYGVVTSDTGSGNGMAHVYLVDANGRKIAAVWGQWDEKFETAHLLAGAPAMYQALRPRLNAKARELLEETIEAERAVGDPAVATAIEMLLQWQNDAAVAIAKAEGQP